MEYLNLFILPIYWVLFKIQKRLTKVETKIEMMNGCLKNKEEGK